ncbi:kinesin, putative, partial [Bodo saltans]
HEQDSFVTIFDPDSTAKLLPPSLSSALQEGERRFAFRDVCGPSTSNDDVYRIAVRPLVEAAWEGYHSTCFAYGVTGCPFSMCYQPLGGNALPLLARQEPYTVMHHALDNELVALSNMEEEESASSFHAPRTRGGGSGSEVAQSRSQITATYVELYNEDIRDLLIDSSPCFSSDGSRRLGSAPTHTFGRGPQQQFQQTSLQQPASKIDIVEDSVAGTILRNASSIPVASMAALEVMLEQGNLRRTKASTNTNECSSRSHAVLQLTIRRRQVVVSNNEARRAVGQTDSTFVDMTSRLSLVDLAGSERAHATSDLTGGGGGGDKFNTDRNQSAIDRRREGATINKSLLALANCINALGQHPQTAAAAAASSGRSSSSASSSSASGAHGAAAPFIPYRDSKLTRLLRDSLGGNTRTVMIATISPSCLCYEETLATLKYATRAKAISRQVTANIVTVPAAITVPTIPSPTSARVPSFSIPPPLMSTETSLRERRLNDGVVGATMRPELFPASSLGELKFNEARSFEANNDDDNLSLLQEWESKVVQARTQLKIAERTADKLLFNSSSWPLTNHQPIRLPDTLHVVEQNRFIRQQELPPAPNLLDPRGPPPSMRFVDPYANPSASTAHVQHKSLVSSIPVPTLDVVECSTTTSERQSNSHTAQQKEEKLKQFHFLQKQLLDLVESKKTATKAAPMSSHYPEMKEPVSAPASRGEISQREMLRPVASRDPAAQLTPLSPNRTYTVGGSRNLPANGKPSTVFGGTKTAPTPTSLPSSSSSSIVDTIRAHWQKEKSSVAARTVDAFLGTLPVNHY